MSASSGSPMPVQSMPVTVNNDIKKPTSISNKTLAIVLFIIAALGVAGSAYWLGDGNFGKGFSDNALGYGIAAAIVGGVSLTCAMIHFAKNRNKKIEEKGPPSLEEVRKELNENSRLVAQALAGSEVLPSSSQATSSSSHPPENQHVARDPSLGDDQSAKESSISTKAPTSVPIPQAAVNPNVSATPSTTDTVPPMPTPLKQTPPSNVPSSPSTASTPTPIPPPQSSTSTSSATSVTSSTSSTPHASSRLAGKANTMNASAENMANLAAQLSQPARVTKTGKNAAWRQFKSKISHATGIGLKKTPTSQPT